MELSGKTVSEVRPMTDEEREEYFPAWRGRNEAVVLVLDDGTRLFPSRDRRGSGPGVMFGADGGGLLRLRPGGDE